MSINPEQPSFASVPATDPPDVSAPDVSLPPSAALSPSTPSSGDSAHRLCPRCHGRMSSVALDKHSFCCKCRGADYNLQNRWDECMSRSLKEMESYVRLRKSLAGKSRNKKSVSSETPSSPRPIAPVGVSLSDVDDQISGHFESFSQSIDQRFELLSSNILDRFTELATTMSARMSNPLFSAEPEVPVRKPVHGQEPSLSPPASIGGCHRQFQGGGGGGYGASRFRLCPPIRLW